MREARTGYQPGARRWETAPTGTVHYFGTDARAICGQKWCVREASAPISAITKCGRCETSIDVLRRLALHGYGRHGLWPEDFTLAERDA